MEPRKLVTVTFGQTDLNKFKNQTLAGELLIEYVADELEKLWPFDEFGIHFSVVYFGGDLVPGRKAHIPDERLLPAKEVDQALREVELEVGQALLKFVNVYEERTLELLMKRVIPN